RGPAAVFDTVPVGTIAELPGSAIWLTQRPIRGPPSARFGQKRTAHCEFRQRMTPFRSLGRVRQQALWKHLGCLADLRPDGVAPRAAEPDPPAGGEDVRPPVPDEAAEMARHRVTAFCTRGSTSREGRARRARAQVD